MEKKYRLLIAVALGVVVLDQWTKFLVMTDLTTAFDGASDFGARLKVFTSEAPPLSSEGYHFHRNGMHIISEDFFRLSYAENPGAAFGLFRSVPDGLRAPLFHLVSIGAVILILYYFRRLLGTREEKWALMGLPLVLGGALGNYVDRLCRGFVIDFLDAHWFATGKAWPSFNIADSAICIGVGLLVVDSFVRKEQKATLLEPSK